MDLARGDQIKNDGKTDDGCNAITNSERRVKAQKEGTKHTPGLRGPHCFL